MKAKQIDARNLTASDPQFTCPRCGSLLKKGVTYYSCKKPCNYRFALDHENTPLFLPGDTTYNRMHIMRQFKQTSGTRAYKPNLDALPSLPRVYSLDRESNLKYSQSC